MHFSGLFSKTREKKTRIRDKGKVKLTIFDGKMDAQSGKKGPYQI